MRQVFLTLAIAALAALFAAGTAVAEEAKITITKKDCRRHTASADVAYRPGVDVRGRKVVPADAGGRVPLKLPNVFEFNIDVDIRKYLGGPEDDAAAASAAVIAADKATTAATSARATADTAEAAANRKAQKFAGLNMTVGKVRYNIKTGALTFNGQSLTDPDQDALAAACRSILKGGK